MVSDTYVRREIQKFCRKKKTRTRYTRYQRHFTANHPRHLGTDEPFFLARQQHLKKTLINTITPPALHFDYYFAFRVMLMIFVCICSRRRVSLIIFIWGRLIFCTYVLFIPGYCFFTWWPTPTQLYPPTHVARVFRGRASFQTEMFVGGGWCWCWWDQPAHAPSNAPSKQLTHQLHPPAQTYPDTMQGFCDDADRLTMEAFPRLLLERSKNIAAGAVA